MVRDEKSDETFRADHLIEDHIDHLLTTGISQEEQERILKIRRSIPDFKTPEEFDTVIEQFKIKNPKRKKSKLGKVYPFNLMFSCQVGPLGDQKAYLRPETA